MIKTLSIESVKASCRESVGGMLKQAASASGLGVTATPSGSKRRLSDPNAQTHHQEYTDSSWSRRRRTLGNLLESQLFSVTISMIIMFNMVIVVLQTDSRSRKEVMPAGLDALSNVLLAIYAVESALRIYVDRWQFPYNRWNMFDFLLVATDVGGSLLELIVGNVPSVAIFRLFRVVRIVRVFKALQSARELFMMLHGLQAAMKAILWATVMIMVAFLLWGLIGVELIQPLVDDLVEQGKLDMQWQYCTRCPHAFENVWSAVLTLLQTVLAGDSWGSMAVPLSEEYPWVLAYFMGSFVSVNLGIMNLIVAVVVDRAHEAREEDNLQKLRVKEDNFKSAKARMGVMFANLDTDLSGTLTREELFDGIDTEPEFANLLRIMDISSEDLELVFKVLDRDGSGELNYTEFTEQLYKLKTHDAHTLLVFVRHQVAMMSTVVSDIFNCLSPEAKPKSDGHDDRQREFGSRTYQEDLRQVSQESESSYKVMASRGSEADCTLVAQQSDPLEDGSCRPISCLEEEWPKLQKLWLDEIRQIIGTELQRHDRLTWDLPSMRDAEAFGGEPPLLCGVASPPPLSASIPGQRPPLMESLDCNTGGTGDATLPADRDCLSSADASAQDLRREDRRRSPRPEEFPPQPVSHIA